MARAPKETTVSDTIMRDWETLRELVNQADLDLRKNIRGNISAGIRARRCLRKMKLVSADLVRTTVEHDREVKGWRDDLNLTSKTERGK